MSSFPHILIRASAGTGKTYALSNRYLGLLYSGISPDQILASTFTRKAAGEILDRVMVRLAEASLKEEPRTALCASLGLNSLSQHRCFEMLGLMIRHLHRLRVCTLDAFFAQLAGSFSLELGLPPGWRIVEPIRDIQLRKEAIEMTLQGDSNREVERLLRLMAKGETTRSISDLVQKTIDDLYGLFMETDAPAWQQIPQPKPLSSELLSETIDALRSAALPEDKRFEQARGGDLSAAEQGDWQQFIGRGLAKKVLDGETVYYRKPIPTETISIYHTLLDHARAALLREVAQQTQASYVLLEKFHTAYGKLKHDAHALKFEDITRTLARSRGFGDIDRQLFRLDSSISHLLLDEFQDTSLAQWQVLRPFARRVTSLPAGPTTSHAADDPSFFCVGDVKQAIYGWRGGLSEIFDALQSELDGVTRDSLNTSYRSSQPVVDTVNQVFRNLTRHRSLEKLEQGVTQWCARFEEHTTARTDLTGYVELSTARAAGEDENIKQVTIEYTAERIKRLVEQAPGCSVGVLARRNQVVAQLIYELRQRGVPASEEGGNPLTDSPAVQLILSLLKLADHPGDTVARFHVARSPLGPLVHFTDFSAEERSWELACEVRDRLMHDGYGPAILRWSQALEPYCRQRDQNRLRQLVELAYQYDQMASLRTTDFQLYIEHERVADPTTAEVRVMTVHQAKGLQFDIVVLPDLDAPLIGQSDAFVVGQPSPTDPIDRVCLYRNSSIQKLLPTELQELFEKQTCQDVNEAICVLYVALTRAIHALHMIVAPSSKSERNLNKTSAGLLRAALTDGQKLGPETTAFEAGDPTWFSKRSSPGLVEPARPVPDADAAVLLAPMDDESHLDHAAPSGLEGGANVAVAHVLDLGSNLAAVRGTLIHALFEQIKWLDDGLPNLDSLRQIASSLAVAQLDVEQQLSSFQQMLIDPAVAAVLRRDFYEPPSDTRIQRALAADDAGSEVRLEVHNERRFAIRDQGRLLSGIIDRLVLLYRGDRLVGADIIDFKTDRASREEPNGLERRVEHYRPQIEAYRLAVATMYRLDPQCVAARLLFVSAGVSREL